MDIFHARKAPPAPVLLYVLVYLAKVACDYLYVLVSVVPLDAHHYSDAGNCNRTVLFRSVGLPAAIAVRLWSSMTPLYPTIRLLISDADCQMKTAILFKSPTRSQESQFEGSHTFERAKFFLPRGYHPGSFFSELHFELICCKPWYICEKELISEPADLVGVSAGSSPSLNWFRIATTTTHVPKPSSRQHHRCGYLPWKSVG